MSPEISSLIHTLFRHILLLTKKNKDPRSKIAYKGQMNIGHRFYIHMFLLSSFTTQVNKHSKLKTKIRKFSKTL